MKRSPALILVAAIGVSLLTARLGWWQLDRAAQKVERQAVLAERQSLQPLEWTALPQDESAAEAQYQRQAKLTGVWLTEHTLYLENRQMAGRPGFLVLTPLRLPDGTVVLVQRGWQPRDFLDRTRVQRPPTPAGEIQLQGRIAPGPARLYEFEGVASGPIRQNLDLFAYASETQLLLRPFTVLQLKPVAKAPEDGLSRDWLQPAAGVHKHYGYAFQWFALSALTVGLYVWFQVILPRRRQQR
jgi:surfeit locus 1 family protein